MERTEKNKKDGGGTEEQANGQFAHVRSSNQIRHVYTQCEIADCREQGRVGQTQPRLRAPTVSIDK